MPACAIPFQAENGNGSVPLLTHTRTLAYQPHPLWTPHPSHLPLSRGNPLFSPFWNELGSKSASSTQGSAKTPWRATWLVSC